MPTRRDIIGGGVAATAGLVFTSCAFLDAHPAHAQPVRRREVVVNGKRVKTIDIHAHCAFTEANALMGLRIAPAALVVSDERIRLMDQQGIDVEALSINPFWYKAPRDLAEKLIKMQNEKLAEVCAANPERFVAFATVAMQFPDLAVQQLEEGVKKLGLRGMSVGTSVGDDELSDPKFHPIWAKCEELDCLVFMHPIAAPEFERRLRGNGGLVNIIGNPLDTTIALSHMIFEGTLDRYPGLKICASHGGGYLPSYAARSDAGCVTFPDRCKAVELKKKPTEYLKQLYYDSIMFTPDALRHLMSQVGSSQIMMGTDYPFPWEKRAVDYILGVPGLSDAERVGILGDTAAKLLGIKT
jgi:aminocarboxymuconate-semialdehyde decarboxylase